MATVKFGGIGYKNPGRLLLVAGDAAKPRNRAVALSYDALPLFARATP